MTNNDLLFYLALFPVPRTKNDILKVLNYLCRLHACSKTISVESKKYSINYFTTKHALLDCSILTKRVQCWRSVLPCNVRWQRVGVKLFCCSQQNFC